MKRVETYASIMRYRARKYMVVIIVIVCCVLNENNTIEANSLSLTGVRILKG